jgi:threonine synthase
VSGGPGPAIGETNPFLRYRQHLDTYRRARRRGWSDQRWIDSVRHLDDEVATIDGTGFEVTPVVRLDTGQGTVWAKVETAGPSGSHKARHLFALAVGLAVDEAPASQTLAIASCGNAAVAAAIVARAAGRPLRVFVPTTADPLIVDRLEALGARITASARRPGERGDPCQRDLVAALHAGDRPFTVQGSLCPGSFDGARTLGLELAEHLERSGWERSALFVQVGGGALATATMEGLQRAGVALPALHPVQARAAHPFVAAWERLLSWRAERAVPPDPVDAAAELAPLMEPWPHEPRSIATGILDDVTYDWLPVASWTLRTGGRPVLVDEETLTEAVAVAATVVPPPDATGAAGLAGWLQARRDGTLDPAVPAVVLLTGVDRSWEATTSRPRVPVQQRSGAARAAGPPGHAGSPDGSV